MDVIQVRYGVDLSSQPDIDAPPEEQQIFERKKAQAKTCSLRAFIYPEEYPNEAPKQFTESERKIQEALRFIYEQNGKDPPLFKKFPNWRQALEIDCTSAPEISYFSGCFDNDKNDITFKKTLKPTAIIGVLAHELKHAEHCTKQIYNIVKQKVKVNNQAIQETRFTDESIAYIFGTYIQMLYYLEDKNLSKENLISKMQETADLMTDVVLGPMINWVSTEPKATLLNKILRRKPQKDYKDLEINKKQIKQI